MADDPILPPLITVLADTATGLFVTDGSQVEGGPVVRLTVPRSPDERRERYTGTPANPFRAATAPEIAAFDLARADGEAAGPFNDRVLRATLLTALWYSLGHIPTPAEVATARTRFIQVYKALAP